MNDTLEEHELMDGTIKRGDIVYYGPDNHSWQGEEVLSIYTNHEFAGNVIVYTKDPQKNIHQYTNHNLRALVKHESTFVEYNKAMASTDRAKNLSILFAKFERK